MNEIDEGTLFMRAMAIDATHAPSHLRSGLELGVLTPSLAAFVEKLVAEDSERLDELAEFVALTVARGVMSHLSGATWISRLGRPVALVAAGELPGDVCDDYGMSFEDEYWKLKQGAWAADFTEEYGSD